MSTNHPLAISDIAKTLTYNLKRLEALIRLGKLPIDGIGVPG